MRCAIKENNVVGHIVDWMRGGDLQPGDRLPTRRELERKLGAGRVTVQRAFDRLIREGFVVSRGRAGTFVSLAPPYMYRYALALPFAPNDNLSFSNFFVSMAAVAQSVTRDTTPRTMSVYWEITGHTDVEDYQRLLEDADSGRLAGVIFGAHPFGLENSALLTDSDVPRVAVCTAGNIADTPSIYPDMHAFYCKALEHAARNGCRHAAVLGFKQQQLDYDAARVAADTLGIDCPPERFLQASPWPPIGIKHAIRALLQDHGGVRPDHLIIADDHLVKVATEAVREVQAETGLELQVIAHCNDPFRPQTAVPVQWLAFSVPALIEACMELLDTQRRGGTVPPMSWVEPRFMKAAADTPPEATVNAAYLAMARDY